MTGQITHHGNGLSSSNNNNYWRYMHVCNTICVVALVGVVIFLFFQLQYLTYQLQTEQDEIDALKIQVQQKQTGQIQQLEQAVENEHDLTVNALAGAFTLLTCLISMFHMSSHLQHFNEPTVQRKIVAILWMSPIYGVTSWLSLLMPQLQGYLAVVKDFYESYCIYTFLAFLIAVLGREGGRDAAVNILGKYAAHLERPARCLRHFYNPPPETSDLAHANAVITECQILAMQFVFIRPLTSIANLLVRVLQDLEEDNSGGRRLLEDEFTNSTSSTDFTNTTTMGNMEEESVQEATKRYFTSPYFFIDMITNLSVFFAFMGLLKFYHAVRNELKWCKPWPKFLTIKGVVFLTFWQGLVIRVVVAVKNPGQPGSSQLALQVQNVLICIEMLFFSITHWCVFPAEEWEKDFQPKVSAKPGIGIQDFVSDVNQIYQSRRGARATRRGDSKGSYRAGGMGSAPSGCEDTFEESTFRDEDESGAEEGLGGGGVIIMATAADALADDGADDDSL
jgi:hypothetical protein